MNTKNKVQKLLDRTRNYDSLDYFTLTYYKYRKNVSFHSLEMTKNYPRCKTMEIPHQRSNQRLEKLLINNSKLRILKFSTIKRNGTEQQTNILVKHQSSNYKYIPPKDENQVGFRK